MRRITILMLTVSLCGSGCVVLDVGVEWYPNLSGHAWYEGATYSTDALGIGKNVVRGVLRVDVEPDPPKKDKEPFIRALETYGAGQGMKVTDATVPFCCAAWLCETDGDWFPWLVLRAIGFHEINLDLGGTEGWTEFAATTVIEVGIGLNYGVGPGEFTLWVNAGPGIGGAFSEARVGYNHSIGWDLYPEVSYWYQNAHSSREDNERAELSGFGVGLHWRKYIEE